MLDTAPTPATCGHSHPPHPPARLPLLLTSADCRRRQDGGGAGHQDRVSGEPARLLRARVLAERGRDDHTGAGCAAAGPRPPAPPPRGSSMQFAAVLAEGTVPCKRSLPLTPTHLTSPPPSHPYPHPHPSHTPTHTSHRSVLPRGAVHPGRGGGAGPAPHPPLAAGRHPRRLPAPAGPAPGMLALHCTLLCTQTPRWLALLLAGELGWRVGKGGARGMLPLR